LVAQQSAGRRGLAKLIGIAMGNGTQVN